MAITDTLPLIEVLCPYEYLSQIVQATICRPYGFFLDGGGGKFGTRRYSYLVMEPFAVISAYGRSVTVQENGVTHTCTVDPFSVLKARMQVYRQKDRTDVPPFLGGAVGFFGYDMGRLIEHIPPHAADDIDMPDMLVGLFSTAIIVDHKKKTVHIASTGLPESRPGMQALKAHKDIDIIRALLQQSGCGGYEKSRAQTSSVRLASNFTRKSYRTAVTRAKQYIEAGDAYQVNLSQRFVCESGETPAAVYRMLMSRSPAPYSCYLNCGDFHVFSISPECFLRVSGNSVTTKPIKGTRPRARDQERDCALSRELTGSAKDRAELLMIVDLERNDLGRVCRTSSISLEKLFAVESFTDVHHLVATIRGELREDIDHVDCLRACFPGGSITGAPKIRAMQIIEELEPCRRKIYTGSIGYMGFHRQTDLSIAIRTILFKEDSYTFHLGGGIVADSDPDLEYEETLHKGASIFQALGVKDIVEERFF